MSPETCIATKISWIHWEGAEFQGFIASFKCFLSSLILASVLETTRGGVGQGKEATSVHVMTLGACDEMRSLSPVEIPVWLLCNSILWSAAPASGGTAWQEAHLIQTLLLIYASYWPVACCQLFDVKQLAPKWGRASVWQEGAWKNGNFLSSPCSTGLKDLAELFITVFALHRMHFFTKPEGWFRSPLKERSWAAAFVHQLDILELQHVTIFHIALLKLFLLLGRLPLGIT